MRLINLRTFRKRNFPQAQGKTGTDAGNDSKTLNTSEKKEPDMLKRILLLTLSICLGAAAAPAALAQTSITEQEAHAIAVDAYVYFYPLLSMDVTRKQFTNVGPDKEMAKGPMNMFSNVPEYPAADFKGAVRS